MRFLAILLLAFVLPAAGRAAVISPAGMTVHIPSGGTPASGGVYTDDVLLDMLTFSGASFNSSNSFAAVSRFEVLTGRNNINAEWGDNDDGADGDDNPFVKAGVAANTAEALSLQESTVPSIQDAALLNAFNSLSLTEMSDGESGAFSFKVMFAKGLQDNDASAMDDVPELIFFERGMNDEFSIEVITGGTFDAPIYSNPYSVNSADFWKSDVQVNTIEITSSQFIGVGGLDLNVFGMMAGQRAYGFRLTVVNSGPDLNGFFLSAEDPTRFEKPLEAVPAPPALPLLVAALAATGMLRLRRRA